MAAAAAATTALDPTAAAWVAAESQLRALRLKYKTDGEGGLRDKVGSRDEGVSGSHSEVASSPLSTKRECNGLTRRATRRGVSRRRVVCRASSG